MFLNRNKIAVGLIITMLTLSALLIYFKPSQSEIKTMLCTNCKAVEIEINIELSHPKWIVVTSIFHPTDQLKQLVTIPGWKMVVVGDEKTPTDWSYPGIIFLSVEDQASLGYEIAKHLPRNSYTRKMIGYLYAIQHGAQFIYDTDDDNCPSGGEITFTTQPTTSGLILAHLNHSLLNPYAHFGQPSLWPRGYPLEHIARPPNHTYYLCTFPTAAIQQGLVNGDPDVDAIYRLINKGSNQNVNINVTFDLHAPPFTLPRGVFAPFNSQNTLFSYHALWALFLPTTVYFRVTDIWRGYWAQTLLWLIGHHLAFHPPNAVQVRNSHNYLKDFEEEIQMYEEAGKMIDFLSKWQCESQWSFYKCVELLTVDMVKEQFIKENDVKLVQMWISDLNAVGYEEPVRVNQTISDMCLPSEISTKNWVNYSPLTSTVEQSPGFSDLFVLCDQHFAQSDSILLANRGLISPKTSFVFENILLVIVFNFPYLQNVRMLEVLYRDHFPNILFCGNSSGYEQLMESVNKSRFKWRRNSISFVDVTEDFEGWFGYECAIRAIEMNYKVDGYLFLGDDVLLKPWTLLPFDFSRSCLQNDTFGQHCDQELKNLTPAHYEWSAWWPKECGFINTNKAFAEIEAIAGNHSDPQHSLFRTFIQNRFLSGVNMSLVSTCTSDLYYIARQDSQMFSQVLRVFLRSKVFVEIAVPSTLIGIRTGNCQTSGGFFGTSAPPESRSDVFKYFTEHSVYVHPLKLPTLESDVTCLQRYCSEFVREYLNNW